jgi:Uncharacterized protein containing a von Willebrand factor type A (vWA) domain
VVLAAALAVVALPWSAPTSVASPVSSDGAKPLILLVDVSSSMDEDGGSGLSKLDGAKAGMRDAISGRSGNLVGLWTFPGDGDCSAGNYVTAAEPVKRSDSSKLKAIISNLAANGNTPTAQALEALGANLTKRGFQEANIVLVSDGESNCSPPKPPCDVARDLVAQGFDITINTIGFNISDAGRDELTCIADATHGSYVSVEDSASLIDELQNQVNPTLQLTATSSPEPAAAGQPVALTVSVANTSTQQDVQDVAMTLAFRSESSSDVMLPVVPPRVKLGSLPAGQSASRTWQFSLEGLASGNQRAVYRAVAYGRLTDGSFVDGAITIDTSQVDTVGPNDWGVNIDGDDQIVIMGDSYSSGQGTWTYERWSDHKTEDPVNGCHTSQLTYGKNSPKKIMNLACSGAVMNNFTAFQYDSASNTSAEPQFEKLAELATAPRIVFLTIGGNDIGFVHIVEDCYMWKSILGVIPTELIARCDQGEQSSLAQAEKKLQRMQSPDPLDPKLVASQLASLYRQVWNEANSEAMRSLRVSQGGSEFAPVVVLPYVSVLKTNNRPCSPTTDFGVWFKSNPLTASDLARLNLLQGQLNQAIEKEVGRASDGGKYGIYFAQGVATATDGHTACDADPAINLVSRSGASPNPESLHPNAAGYQRIGTRLRLFLASEDFNFTDTGTYQVGQQLSFCPRVALLGDNEIRDKLPRLELAANPQETVTETQLASCDYGVIYITGMLPGSSADISIHSTPTLLATVTANSEGVAEGVIMIPDGLEPGQHTLVVDGLDATGKPFSSSAPVTVSVPTPWYVWVCGAVGVGALMAGAVLLLVARRKRARTRVEPAGPGQ